MQYFRILTLVDITRTNVFKDSIDPFQKRQQDNFQTLHQTLEMRGIVFTESDPKMEMMDWTKHGYGRKEATWVWEISTERDDLYLLDDNPVGGMILDIEYVPFVDQCSETAYFKQCVFSARLKPINILFEGIDK